MGITIKELGTQLDAIAEEWSSEENGRSIYFAVMEKKPDDSIDVASGGRGDVRHMIRAMAEQVARFGKHSGQPKKIALLFTGNLFKKLQKDIGEDPEEGGDPDAPET